MGLFACLFGAFWGEGWRERREGLLFAYPKKKKKKSVLVKNKYKNNMQGTKVKLNYQF